MYDSHSQEKNDMLSMVHAYNVLYLIQFTWWDRFTRDGNVTFFVLRSL